jgi:hypothetical protein
MTADAHLWAIGYDDTAQAKKIRHGPDDHVVELKIASAEGLLAAAAANKPAGGDSLTQASSEAQVVEAN